MSSALSRDITPVSCHDSSGSFRLCDFLRHSCIWWIWWFSAVLAECFVEGPQTGTCLMALFWIDWVIYIIIWEQDLRSKELPPPIAARARALSTGHHRCCPGPLAGVVRVRPLHCKLEFLSPGGLFGKRSLCLKTWVLVLVLGPICCQRFQALWPSPSHL